MKENWTYKKLGEVCEILNGFAFKSEEYENNGIRVMRITNVQKGEIVDDDPKFFPLKRKDEITKYLLREGDVLMSLTGNVGRVGIMEEQLLPAALNQRVACLRLMDNEIDKRYLFHILNSDTFENDCVFNAAGIAQKNMSTRWLEQYKIPVPPIETQSRIVSELDLLQSIIDKQKAQLKELDNLAQAVFYDMFGDPVENEKGWEVKRFGELCTIITDGEHATPRRSESGIYLLSARNIHNHNLDLKEVDYIDTEEYNRIAKRIIPRKGDVLISCSGSVGRVCIAPNIKFQMVRSVALLRLIDGVCPVFFEYLICSDYVQKQINNSKVQVAQANLFQGKIKALNAVVPPLNLQQSFAAKIESIEKQKAAINQSIAETQRLFDYTMDKYFG